MGLTTWLQIVPLFLLLCLAYLYSRKIGLLNQAEQRSSTASVDSKTDKLRVAAMLDSIGDGVVATDPSGKIIFMNRVAEDILSWDPSMIGLRLADISLLTDENGKHVPVDLHPLHRCIETKEKIITKDYRFVQTGRFDFAVYIAATPIILNDVVVGAIEVFRDITKEKEIDKAKSEFVYLASHQLRTPLSTISWYLELLLSQDAGPINTDQRTYLDEAYHSTRHMVELVNEILDVSRLDLGTMTTKIEPVDLVQTLEEAIDEVKPMVDKKGITLTRDLSDNLPPCNTDQKKIRIIFQNLITNAVKYTPEKGSVTVTVKKIGDNLNLAVADTGYGIPENVQSKIFSKLFRADNIKEREPSGTGLGLYTVKSVVEQLGGTITFTSVENKGTTFSIVMPFHEKIPPTVLVIDDDKNLRSILRLALEKNGIRFLEADTGEKGLSVADAEKPDLIVLDIILPTMSGTQVLQKMQADAGLAKLPVIILTNVSDNGLAEQLEPYHPLGVLVKANLKLENVIQQIKAALPKK